MLVGVVLVGVVTGCAVGVEEDDDDDEVMEEEEEVVEEDDALMVTLKYCDLNRGPLTSSELCIPSQKRLLRERFCVGLPSQE